MNRIAHFLADLPTGEPWRERPTPSGSSFAITTVHADAMARGDSAESTALVDVSLERALGSDGAVLLTMQSDRDLGAEADSTEAVALYVHSPNALRALVRALLELMENPNGAAMLASIKPKPFADPGAIS